MRNSRDSSLKKLSAKEINDISFSFSSIPKIIKKEITQIKCTHTLMPWHRPSLFTQRNKLMGFKGIEHSQEIYHPAITWGVMQKMVIFTPIWYPSAHNHTIGGLTKVSIIYLFG